MSTTLLNGRLISKFLPDLEKAWNNLIKACLIISIKDNWSGVSNNCPAAWRPNAWTIASSTISWWVCSDSENVTPVETLTGVGFLIYL